MKILGLTFLLAMLAASAAGCGYSLQGSGTSLPADVRKIYIPRTQNLSTETILTSLMTEALEDRFERFGVVTVVDSVNDADAILETKILKVKRGTRTSTGKTDTALQLNTSLYIYGELRKMTGEIIWREPSLAVTKSFGTSRDVIVTSSADFANQSQTGADISALNDRELARGQEQEALASLADQAAAKIYDIAVAPDF